MTYRYLPPRSGWPNGVVDMPGCTLRREEGRSVDREGVGSTVCGDLVRGGWRTQLAWAARSFLEARTNHTRYAGGYGLSGSIVVSRDDAKLSRARCLHEFLRVRNLASSRTLRRHRTGLERVRDAAE